MCVCVCRWRSISLKKKRICKCKVAAVNMQVEISKHLQFQKVFLNFPWGLQGSVGWCPRNATLSNEMSILKNWGEVAVWVWARKLPKMRFCVAPLCFDRQNCGEVRAFCVWMVLPRSSCNNVVWSLKKNKGEIDTLFAHAKPFSTKCV